MTRYDLRPRRTELSEKQKRDERRRRWQRWASQLASRRRDNRPPELQQPPSPHRLFGIDHLVEDILWHALHSRSLTSREDLVLRLVCAQFRDVVDRLMTQTLELHITRRCIQPYPYDRRPALCSWVYDAKTCQADWPWSRSEYALASVRRLFIKQRIENFRRHLSKLNRLWAAFPALQEVVTQSPVDLLPIKGLRAHTAIHLTFSIRAGESQWRLPGLRDVYNFAGSATRLVLHIDLMDTWTDSSRRDKSLRAKAAAFDKDSKLRSVAIIFGRHDILSIRHSPVFRIHTFVRDLANHILQFPACAYEIVNAATLNERDFCVGMGTDPLPSDRAHALLRQVLCDALSCTTDLRTAQKHLETVRFLTFAQQVGSHTEIDLGRWSSWGALERRSAVFQHASTFRSLLKS